MDGRQRTGDRLPHHAAVNAKLRDHTRNGPNTNSMLLTELLNNSTLAFQAHRLNQDDRRSRDGRWAEIRQHSGPQSCSLAEP